MADGGYDPCECIWSHEQAMRRLISLLRSSQGYCSSDECYQDMPGPSSTPAGGDSTFFLLMMGWIVLAIVLFFLRPQSVRDRGISKPTNNQGPNNNPPSDPVQ